MLSPKFKIILGLSLIFLIFVIYGYSKAVPKKISQGGPKITIEPESWNFGQVEYGKVIEKEFLVKNRGKEILEINRVSTSCACTSAKIDKEKIELDEAAELLVTYDTGAMSGFHAKGKQERIIYIKSNDPENPQVEITIYADVQ